jgi:hypothetical protein
MTYLHAWTNPRRAHDDSADSKGGAARASGDESVVTPGVMTGGAGSSTPYSVRLGQAFTSMLEHLDPARMPRHGGTATTFVVTMDFETLKSGLGIATTDTGLTISASEARRMACTGLVVPAVLGGKSEVLDLGRGKRLYEAAQRRAMAIRDKHCRAEGCDIPAAWCEAHHLVPWSKGGKTNLADGLLLCPHHHHRAHDDRYLHERTPSGDLRFHRRR